MASAVALLNSSFQSLSAQLLVLSLWLQNALGSRADAAHRKLGPIARPTERLPPLTMLEGSTTGLAGLFNNAPFLAAFTAFAAAQIAKVFTYYYTEGKWDINRIVGSGGMPSSHTAFVMGLTTAVGIHEGTNSSMFAICLVLSLIVMYDASGVRLHAGRQASVLNLIISELPPDHPVQESGRLRDTLGHTPLQVFVGAILGMMVGYLFQVTWQVRHPAHR